MNLTQKALFIGGSHDGMILDVEVKYSVMNMLPLKDWGLCDSGQLENYRRHKFIDQSGQIIVYVLDGITEALRKENEELSAAISNFNALIEFVQTTDEPMKVLYLWQHGCFEELREFWPEAPETIYPKGRVK